MSAKDSNNRNEMDESIVVMSGRRKVSPSGLRGDWSDENVARNR